MIYTRYFPMAPLATYWALPGNTQFLPMGIFMRPEEAMYLHD